MTDTLQTGVEVLTAEDAAEIFEEWFDDFVAAIESGSEPDLVDLFTEDATWRDFMAFPWDFHNAIGRAELVSKFLRLVDTWRAAEFAPNQEQPPKVWGGGITCFFDFTTTDRVDRGYVMLVEGPDGFAASAMQTQVVRLAAIDERIGEHRPDGKVYGIVPNRTRWSDDRQRGAAFEDSDPAVVVLGAGHNGLSVAARLGALDVPTLVLEREARIGDTWRKRYASLALHSTVWGDHMPYMPFPPTWTAHTPRDKLAEWLELYATALDLNVWTSSTFLSGQYDEANERWMLRVQRADGSLRLLRPRHFIVAGGMFAGPKVPEIKGLDTFTGVWAHSDSFQDGARYDGKRALIVGAGVSGHELAHDLWEHGSDVTLLQRSATYVISFEAQHKFWNPLFVENMLYAPEFADMIQYAVPFERTDPINKHLVKLAAEFDRELLDRLEAAGFKLEWGPDGTGILGAHMSGYDGYQINIGGSELIADGSVHLKQGVEVAEVRDSTVVFTDGSELHDVDLILFATGYHQFWGHIKPMLGKAAERVGKVYGRAADGEYANVWRRSDQPGLWFATGFLRMTRFYSQFTAMLIKAIEMGLEPIDPARANGRA